MSSASDSPTPLENDPEILSRLRLSLVSGVGPRIYRQLVERFGSAAAVLTAEPAVLREIPGVGKKLVQALATVGETDEAALEIESCRRLGIELVHEGRDDYPRQLREIHDPPAILYRRGTHEPGDALAVAIVGTRHSTHYGERTAERLAFALVQAGFVVVSGLARGIDAAAHRGALAAGGRTLAVLGGGLAEIYPPEHKQLAEDVVRHGALLTESASRAEPLPGMFPQRNRIISGLSLGVIVVEAPLRSGALSTAKHAMEQGREVFAVPGRIDDTAARGCHQLLRDGATLVESIDDVLGQLGPLVAPAARSADASAGEVRHPAELQLGDQEKQVLGAVRDEPTSLDEISTICDLPIQRILATVSALEIRRLVKRVSGNTVMRLYGK